jgi:glycosyltransferase involved in cell wall biosynthesis
MTNEKFSPSTIKNVLLVAYYFPPNTAVGGIRIVNCVKYLPSFDWNPYVLTIHERYIEEVDPSRLDCIEADRIFRTCKLSSFASWTYLKLKKVYISIVKRNPAASYGVATRDADEKNDSSRPESVFQKLKRFIASLLVLPDGERGWVLPAALRAVREIRRNNISCIVTSGPPHSAHLIGYLVEMITGVKWVVDFRDPWVIDGSKPLLVTTDSSMKLDRWLEKKVIQKADLIIANTENLQNTLKKEHKNQPSRKFLCIPNGFDEGIFQKMDHLKKYDKFTIIYTGTLYYGRTPEPVFQALKELIQDGDISSRDICVKLVGHCKQVNRYPTAKMIENYNLGSVAEVLEPVPYAEALAMVKQSHLALLLAIEQPLSIPAKAYEYMGSGTRILTLTEAGATADLVRSTGTGVVFDPSDVEGIKHFILQSMKNPDSLTQNDTSHILNKFDRKFLTQKLADELDRICTL